MKHEKLLSKIKKLLALSKSSNPHEAAKALEMAQKLMAEHRIDQIDVEIMESSGKQTFARVRTPRYIHYLMTIIRKAFGVEGYFSNENQGIGEVKNHAVFFGTEERPQIASYCFDVLYRQLTEARKEFIATQSKRLKRRTLIARADTYCEGWAEGVYQVVQRFVMTEEETERLMQYEQKLKSRSNFSTGKIREAGTTRGGDTARLQGYYEGKKVKLNHGVNGTETKKLGAKNENDIN